MDQLNGLMMKLRRRISITIKDVRDFINKHVEQKKQLRGMNSFIAQRPKQEYQMDSFFISKKDFPNETYVGGLLVGDIFTKFINIIPIKTKTIPEILEAIKTVIGKWGSQNQFMQTMRALGVQALR